MEITLSRKGAQPVPGTPPPDIALQFVIDAVDRTATGRGLIAAMP